MLPETAARSVGLRVAVVAETFLPGVDGVVNSVLRTVDHLAVRGHDPVVVAPSGAGYESRCGARIEVVTVPAMRLPRYRQLALARPAADLTALLRLLAPDVVHLASPAVLGLAAWRYLARVVASLDLFVHPGADETFCQAVQESLAAGVPAVVTAAGGPLDLVRHRENGWLWAGDDPQVLAAVVAGLRDDRAALAAAAAQARLSVAGRTWGRVGDELIGHLHGLLGAGAAEPAGHGQDRIRQPL